jgi:hypothetical protein
MAVYGKLKTEGTNKPHSVVKYFCSKDEPGVGLCVREGLQVSDDRLLDLFTFLVNSHLLIISTVPAAHVHTSASASQVSQNHSLVSLSKSHVLSPHLRQVLYCPNVFICYFQMLHDRRIAVRKARREKTNADSCTTRLIINIDSY